MRAGDAEAMWGLLSASTQRRERSLESFRRAGAPRLEKALRPFTQGPFRLVVSEAITGRFGVVGVVRGRRAYAVPLRLDRGEWKVELPGPLTIEVLGPRPGSRGAVAQIGVEVHGGGTEGDAVLYADGVTLLSKVYTGPRSATVFANLASRLTPGLHNAVAFATRGGNAAAIGWTFVAQ